MSKRRHFSDELKHEAVALANQPRVTLAQISRDLGISANMLSRWRRELETNGTKAFPGQGHARDEEMAKLKRELALVKRERDFLREAAAYFAKESKASTK
ncbi:hypothetical protein BOW37_11610 [Solemya velum gill symbiont]|nr:transposase [Solemya velum gill symbiont]OOZ43296.1 hypothetical protein BOW37_11610 [Solemya velum gill symbiont]OOZ44290.1 hypothetical protein BOW38_11700 [Solemya velum gill symbiont]OOZ48061.1 hypothetical protein BOW39_12615 [Solemya velum gill symbiont]OOZ49542.1 hypothetical protein BOW40_11645 [Solemya velum gill symbiont]OOZ53081.1 hypothetical protein BOW41_11795 [Solemya velum gill symbiont]